MTEELSQYIGLAKFLKDALGERYEVILRSAADMEQVFTVKDRALVHAEAEIEMLSEILHSTQLQKQDYLCSFSESEGARMGKKNSYYYLRNPEGQIIGFLCIYENEDNLVTVREVFDRLIEKEDDGEAPEPARKINTELDFLMQENIRKIWERYQSQGEKLTKKVKLDFMREIYDTGLFRMKGAAPQISAVTGLPQASIYRYLGEIIEE